MSPGIILVFTVNSIGAVFQLVYITIFIIHAEGSKKVIVGSYKQNIAKVSAVN